VSEPVNVKLIDREFLIACEPDERPGLVAAAAFLDTKMRELRRASKAPGFDRLAVLAAISIAHELLALRQQSDAHELALSEGLGMLRRKLESALDATARTQGS
jgi:cell division protein ZapA